MGLGDSKLQDNLTPALLELPNNEKVESFENFNFKWTKSNHKYSSTKIKKTIETILILNLNDRKTNNAKYLEGLFYLLPKEILIEMFQFLDLY